MRYALKASDSDRMRDFGTLEKAMTIAARSLWIAWPTTENVTVFEIDGAKEPVAFCVISLPDEDEA